MILESDFDQACNNKRTDESNNNGFFQINKFKLNSEHLCHIYFKSSYIIHPNTKNQHSKITIPTIVADENVFK